MFLVRMLNRAEKEENGGSSSSSGSSSNNNHPTHSSNEEQKKSGPHCHHHRKQCHDFSESTIPLVHTNNNININNWNRFRNNNKDNTREEEVVVDTTRSNCLTNNTSEMQFFREQVHGEAGMVVLERDQKKWEVSPDFYECHPHPLPSRPPPFSPQLPITRPPREKEEEERRGVEDNNEDVHASAKPFLFVGGHRGHDGGKKQSYSPTHQTVSSELFYLRKIHSGKENVFFFFFFAPFRGPRQKKNPIRG